MRELKSRMKLRKILRLMIKKIDLGSQRNYNQKSNILLKSIELELFLRLVLGQLFYLGKLLILK